MGVITYTASTHVVTCDHVGCPRTYSGMVHETVQDVLRCAELRGWLIHPPYTNARCPEHKVEDWYNKEKS